MANPGFFPYPSGFSFSMQLNPNGPAARANDACEHLLPGGGTMPATASPPGGAVSAACLSTQPPCLSIHQDTRSPDSGTGQLEGGS